MSLVFLRLTMEVIVTLVITCTAVAFKNNRHLEKTKGFKVLNDINKTWMTRTAGWRRQTFSGWNNKMADLVRVKGIRWQRRHCKCEGEKTTVSCQCGGEKITVSCQCGGEKITVSCQCGGEKITTLSVWRWEDNSQLSVWRWEDNSQLSVWRGEDDRRCHDEVEKIPHVVC